MNTRRIFIACRLSPGAFSGEVVFEIDTHDGNQYVGVAPRRNCRLENDEPVPEGNFAGANQWVMGKLVGRLIANGGEVARVALPDGEDVLVSEDLVTERESEIGSAICLTERWSMRLNAEDSSLILPRK